MDRGAWQATIRGVARVRHELVTKPKTKPQSTKERYMIHKQE